MKECSQRFYIEWNGHVFSVLWSISVVDVYFSSVSTEGWISWVSYSYFYYISYLLGRIPTFKNVTCFPILLWIYFVDFKNNRFSGYMIKFMYYFQYMFLKGMKENSQIVVFTNYIQNLGAKGHAFLPSSVTRYDTTLSQPLESIIRFIIDLI